MKLPGKKDFGMDFGPVTIFGKLGGDLLESALNAASKGVAKKAAKAVTPDNLGKVAVGAVGSLVGAAVGAAVMGGSNKKNSKASDNGRPLPPPPPSSGSRPPVPPGHNKKEKKTAQELMLDTAIKEFDEAMCDFPDQMHALLNSALVDGVLTDSERRVLTRKALASGMDEDEFALMLDALLLLRQRVMQLQGAAAMAAGQQTQPQPPAAPPAPAHTAAPTQKAIEHCPNCGAAIESGITVCKECGFAFTHIKANSSSERLSQLISQIEQKRSRLSSVFDSESENNRITNEKVEVINNFAVPNSKADLLEFLVTTQTRSQYKFTDDASVKALAKAYKKKFEECKAKAKVFFGSDKDFEPFFAEEPRKKRFGLF